MSHTIQTTGIIWARQTGDQTTAIYATVKDDEARELVQDCEHNLLDDVTTPPSDGLWVWEGRVATVYASRGRDSTGNGRWVETPPSLDVIATGAWRRPDNTDASIDVHGRNELERLAYEEAES